MNKISEKKDATVTETLLSLIHVGRERECVENVPFQ